jgi:hypothetical protein
MNLIEELFSKGVMTMGASKTDPARQVGVFRPEALSQFPAIRAAEMEKFRWIAGDWDHENHVPATRLSPAYIDAGSSRFSVCERDSWICSVAPDGRETRNITFDPFSRRWIYVLAQGSYGVLRSSDGWAGNRIVFLGMMTMLGIDCEWRMSWTRHGDGEFSFVNERLGGDGSWEYIDQWRFQRK